MSPYTDRYASALNAEATSRNYQQVVQNLMIVQARTGITPLNPDELTDWFAKPPAVDLVLWQGMRVVHNHEITAWVAAWRSTLPAHFVPYSYLGLTSSNLIDCARAIAMEQVIRETDRIVDRILRITDELGNQLKGNLREGRTHGQAAAPVEQSAVYTRFSHRLVEGMHFLYDNRPPGALGGPTGNPDQRVLDDGVRSYMAQALGISIDPFPTQVADRQRWLVFAQGLTRIIGTCEQLATHHRLESISSIDRFQESFNEGYQRGSSSMPHKRNPIRSERICGLARVARGHLHSLAESATNSWWERDLTNSSVERIAWYELVGLTGFILDETRQILAYGEVKATDLTDIGDFEEHIQSHHDLITRQLDGQDPDDAYREIQSR